jgi:hypothetical protein
MHPYFELKQKLFNLTRRPLEPREPSGKLAGVYYSQTPDVIADTLSFYLFRKYSERHYPILYFHPISKPLDKEFVLRFDVKPVALADISFISKLSYSFFLTSPDFYKRFDEYVPSAEFYLIFQSDSFLIQHGLEQFMEYPYDYYGAVWEKGVIDGAWCEPRNPQAEVVDPAIAAKLKPVRVGNGGFSLRRIGPCREVCNQYRLEDLSYMQEDAFYCNFGQLTGLRFAPEDLARKFAWEDAPAISTYMGKMGIERPLGFHNLPVEMAEIILTKAIL